jgi:hypothetical protein
MEPAFKPSLIEVWRQALLDNAKFVRLGSEQYPVRRTAKSRLCQIDFQINGEDFRGLEQNPNTSSRWAHMARSGKKVMQFLQKGKYVANVADGKLTVYG